MPVEESYVIPPPNSHTPPRPVLMKGVTSTILESSVTLTEIVTLLPREAYLVLTDTEELIISGPFLSLAPPADAFTWKFPFERLAVS